jgi:ABC-type multidrug transport system fused ATPase/permease subunit
MTRALVAARRATNVLRLQPEIAEPQAVAAEPPPLAELVDTTTGLVVRPGALTVIVTSQPTESAALAERLGRYVDPDDGERVTLGGVSLRDLPVDVVRRRILVNDTDTRLFTGVLRYELDPSGTRSEEDVLDAIETASAADVLDALPDRLDARVEERGRSFSGGQRQRLMLVRALLVDPEVLVLVEPTSAVDAHTEARIAERLRDARAGRTTVIMSASPLVLDRADEVVLLLDGRVAALGRHRDLLANDRTYRAVVTREEVLA